MARAPISSLRRRELARQPTVAYTHPTGQVLAAEPLASFAAPALQS